MSENEGHAAVVEQLEMPDGTVIDQQSSAYHDDHGSVTVLNIKNVAGAIEVKFHVEPGRDDKTFTLSEDQLRTRWGTRIASTPADLPGRDF